MTSRKGGGASEPFMSQTGISLVGRLEASVARRGRGLIKKKNAGGISSSARLFLDPRTLKTPLSHLPSARNGAVSSSRIV